MQEAGQDPWIGSKLSGLLSDNQFDVYDVQERYLSYGKKDKKAHIVSLMTNPN